MIEIIIIDPDESDFILYAEKMIRHSAIQTAAYHTS
jgi:hypothetical protein